MPIMNSDTMLTSQFSDVEGHGLPTVAQILHLTQVQVIYIALGSALGLVLSIALAVYLVWKHREQKIKEDALKLERDRVVAHAGRNARLLTAPLLLFRFCDLSEESCKQALFKGCRLVSFVDYVAALQIPGGFDWQRAIHTLLVDRNLSILLPATEFLPLKRQLVDPFDLFGGGTRVYRLLRAALSPLHLAALGEVIHLAAIEDDVEHHSLDGASRSVERTPRMSCMRTYIIGEREQKLPEDVAALTDEVALFEDLSKLLEGLSPEDPVDTVQPTKGVAWLPDVSFSHVGHAFRSNAWQVKCGLVFAVLLNRLSCNMMPDSWRPQDLQAAPIKTPGELLAAMKQHTGVQFFMQIVSRTASFGLGCAVKQDDQWLQMPLVLPLRTGVCMLNGRRTRSSGTPEITTLMPHAEMALRVTCPGEFSFRVAWYQGVEGFTGWHSGNEVVLPWNNSPEVEVVHTDWTDAQCAEAADIAAAVAGATNHMADTFHLPVGGYAYYGVCLDSIAALQAALQQPVTIFPCMLSGQPKAQLALAYVELKREMQQLTVTNGEYGGVLADKARRGLLKVPCDVRHEPSMIPDAIRRLQACLPAVSPYLTLENARMDLKEAAEQYGSQSELHL